MTKKISHIFISLLLITLTAGVSVSRHYCGNTLVSVSFFQPASSGCQDNSGSCSDEGCCHNEHQLIQMEDSYLFSAVHDSVQFFPVILAIIDPGLIYPAFSERIHGSHLLDDSSPPPPDLITILSGLQIFRL